MNWLKNKIQNEKGSITLYVLITMMLFLSVSLVTYMQSKSKNSTQLQQLGEIQKEYQSNDIDEIYKETEAENKGKINVTFYTPDGKVYNINEWTNQDLIMKITYPYDVKEEDQYYYLDGEKIKYTENETIENNCVISVEYKDKKQEVKITRIDKTPATVTFDKNGDEYILEEGEKEKEISTKVVADDGKGSGVSKIEYQILTSSNMPEINSDGWKEINYEQTIEENKTGGTYYIYVKVTDVAGNIKIYKSNQFKISYKITYDANEGSGAPAEQIKEHGIALTLSSTEPTRTGYTFLGWSTSKTATSATYLPGASYTLNESVTLYAVWSTDSYTVTYDYKTNGGTSASKTSATANYGSAIDLTPTATKSGYVFVGWNTNKDATKGLDSLTMGTSNVTLYAIYKKDIVATFKYYNNQANTVSKTVYNNTTSAEITAPGIENASKDSLTFTGRGWSTADTANANIELAAGGKVTLTGNKTYYASYETTITATLYTFDGSAKGAMATKTGTAYLNHVGSITNASIALGTTSSSGYTFRGWSTSNVANAEITVEANGTASINTDTTYFASYTLTVTAKYYYYNGSSYTSSTASVTVYQNYAGTRVGAKPTTPTVSNPSGWTARGWSTSSSVTATVTTPGTITKDTTYYYSWQKTVTLTYDANEGSGAPSVQTGTAYLNYAGTVTEASFDISSTKPTRSGWTFQNWNTESDGTGTLYSPGGTIKISANDTLYAIWKDITPPTIGLILKEQSSSEDTINLVGKARDIGSGISYYQFSTQKDLTADSSGWVEIENTTEEVSLSYPISDGNIYYFYVKDAFENINMKQIVITKTVSLYSGPTKTEYKNFEAIDYTGLKLKLDFGDGIYKIIDGEPYVTSCIENDDASNGIRHEITIEYENNIFKINTYKLSWYYNENSSTNFVDWYYYENNGQKVTGERELENAMGSQIKRWYLFDSNGLMQRGWKTINGKYKYYLIIDATVGNREELLSNGFNDGSLATNTWVQIYNTGDQRYYWYHFDANGYMQTGWLYLNGYYYYLKPSGFTAWSGPEGSMIANTTVTINGTKYTFDEGGVCLNP